jgi:hypothetical protein
MRYSCEVLCKEERKKNIIQKLEKERTLVPEKIGRFSYNNFI